MTDTLKDPQTGLYPPIEPYRIGRLKVSDLHELYFEESGNPQGKPVVFLHGGPGSESDPKQRRFFNPEKYRIILFDQRGCGKSAPVACLDQNTTWDLVADIEKLKKHLGISRWLVFGGSWGSTLALAYAETHPTSVTELVLRGIFLLRKKEIEFFYQTGADWFFPEAWETYRNFIPEAERDNFVKAYHKRLTGTDLAVQKKAARIWSVWEGSCSRLIPDPRLVDHYGSDRFSVQFARIECHYFFHGAFFEEDGQLLRDADRLCQIPTTIVHGRYDMVCPVRNAWDLCQKMPHADLKIIPDAGHSLSEPGISKALVEACDRYSQSP